jgi:hypothetical protein
MRTSLIFLLVAIALILAFYLTGHFYLGKSAPIVHIRDSYYVLAYYQLCLVLAIFFFLGGVIGTRFKNWYYLLPFLLLLAFEVYWMAKMFLFIKTG